MLSENMDSVAQLAESLNNPKNKYAEALREKKIYYKFGLEAILAGGKVGPIELRTKYNMMDDYDGNPIE